MAKGTAERSILGPPKNLSEYDGMEARGFHNGLVLSKDVIHCHCAENLKAVGLWGNVTADVCADLVKNWSIRHTLFGLID